MSKPICLFNSDYAYRIPSIVKTENALVAVCNLGASENDYGFKALVCKRSEDGGETWSEQSIIALPPAREISADKNSSKSAFFIDPCMAVADNGDIILLATFFPESKGIMDTKFLEKKTAFAGFNSNVYPIIYDRDGNFYTVLEDGGIIDSKKSKTPYRLKGLGELYKDDEYCGNIYLNGAMGKSDIEHKTTFGAPLKSPKRSFVFMFKSSDEGKTCSEGKDITGEILLDSDGVFLGTAPGNALKTNSGRLVFPLYTLKDTVCVYSDDNGETFKRNIRNPYTDNIDEWCAVQAKSGDIYSFGRAKKFDKTPVSISKDNAITFIKDKKAPIKAPKCQKSALSAENKVFLCHPSGKVRENGVISQGEFVFDKKSNCKGIKWSKETISVNEGFFAYSSLCLINGKTLGVLYEDQPTGHIVFQKIEI